MDEERSLSADGDTAIVGGCFDNAQLGAAWVWTRSGGLWTQQGTKLVGSGAVGAGWQGISVTLSADGNTAIVGGTDDNGAAGAAWVWKRIGGVWTQQGTELVGSGAVGGAQQGRVSLSADGNTAIVGGPLDNSDAGAAWVFAASAPVMSIVKTHSGNFAQSENGATYNVTVTNATGAGPTSGTVTMTETVPSGMTLVSMNGGATWNCTVLPTCTRSDSLASGASYPTITVTVNVASNATSPQLNSVSVTGGGSVTATATDSTIINPTTSHPAFFTGEVALANSVYSLQLQNGKPFGYYGYLSSG
jgi:uncharacterized repeat protein (TIGR01451 family)